MIPFTVDSGSLLTYQEIQDLYDQNPDLTLRDMSYKAGLPVSAIKRILLTDLNSVVYQQPTKE